MFEGNAVRSHAASITGEGRAASEHRDKFSIPLDGKAEKSKGENPSGTKPNYETEYGRTPPVVNTSCGREHGRERRVVRAWGWGGDI